MNTIFFALRFPCSSSVDENTYQMTTATDTYKDAKQGGKSRFFCFGVGLPLTVV